MSLLAVPAARVAQPGDVAPAVQWTSDSARLPLVLVKVTVYRSGTAVTATGAAAATAVAGLSGCYGAVQCSGSLRPLACHPLLLLALLPDALSCSHCCLLHLAAGAVAPAAGLAL